MNTFTTAAQVEAHMEAMADPQQRRLLMTFFKTGPGQYGEGDEFLGLRVPQTRLVVAQAGALSLDEVSRLLLSPWHEVRLCGLLLMVSHFERLATRRLTADAEAIRRRDEILRLYLRLARRANNWDLVDLSAPRLLGRWLLLPTDLGGELGKNRTMDRLAGSTCLWEQRISMVATQMPTRHADPSWCLLMAERHLSHPHDLMHKAVGWMLREVGKYVSVDLLRGFLVRHVHQMSRTTLRYAIERLDPDERRSWMSR